MATLYPQVVEPSTPTTPLVEQKQQGLVYGYSAPPPVGAPLAGAYYQYPAPPVRRQRSRGCVICCSICACLMFTALIVGILFLVLYLRCVNAVVGIENVKLYGPLGTNVTSIAANFEWGKIEVLSNASDTNVSFTVTTKAATKSVVDKMKVYTTFVDGKLSLVVDGQSKDFFDCPQVEVKIVIPAGVVVPDIDFSLTNGNIKFGNIAERLGHVKGKSTNGKIEIEDINAVSVDLETTNGEAKITKVNATSIKFVSTNGDVEGDNYILPAAPCYLELATTNGEVDVKHLNIASAASGSACDLKISSTNGDISYGDVVGFLGHFDMSTTNGDVGVHGAVSYDTNSSTHKTGTAHSGGPMHLKGYSTNGDAEVTFN